MKNTIPNRKAICDVLMEHAKEDKDIVVLCSDSRGSASLAPFFAEFPEQSVEVGIAEQDLVSIAAGMAACGKKPFAASPASFVSTRSYEQCKVDVAYSRTNVKLIGISGGISYGALGMSHHSAQDIAAMSAIPGMRVYLPSDRFQTAKLIAALLEDQQGAYIRVGRNPVEDVYNEESCPFEMDKATAIRIRSDGGICAKVAGEEEKSADVVIVACGEMVYPSVCAAKLLKEHNRPAINVRKEEKAVVTVEEHSPFGGLGSMVSQVIGAECPKKVINIALPDSPVITGTSQEVFDYYGMNAEGIAKKAQEALA